MSEFAGDARGWIVKAASDGDAQLTRVHGLMEADEIRPGFSDVGTHNLLTTLTLNLRPQRVLEIGTHIGTATVVVASALRTNGYGRIYTIEPQDAERERARGYVGSAGLTDRVEFIAGLSHQPETKAILQELAPFELVFIDGSHEYDHIRHDLDFCYSILRNNGVLVLHDVGQSSAQVDASGKGGPRRAMQDFLSDQPDASGIFFEYPLWLNPCGAGLICKQTLDPAP